MNVLQKYLPLFLVAAVVSACAPAAVVERERFFWPSPPNPPRIEWLGSYSSQLDLKMTSLRSFKEFFVGEDAPVKLGRPLEVRSDAELDKIYVADLEEGGVFIFDVRNNELRKLNTAGSRVPEKIIPVGMALDKKSNLYILEPRLQKLLVFDSSEHYTRSIDLKTATKRPVAIAIDKDRGRLYVSDVQLNKIFAFDLDGTYLFSFGAFGTTDGVFNKPVSIAVGTNGDIVVADAFNARIQIFNESGKFLRVFGQRGDGVGNFQLIKSVALDPDNNIYVVDGRSHTINIFNRNGELLLVVGGFYSIASSGKAAPAGFALPTGIDIDRHGKIFVADQLNARIQVFQYLPENTSPPLPR